MPSNEEIAIQRAKADLEAAKRSGNATSIEDAKEAVDKAYDSYIDPINAAGQANGKSRSWFGI